MAFDKVEIKVIMQVSTVVKSKMPVAWGWLSAISLLGHIRVLWFFFILLAMIRYVFG